MPHDKTVRLAGEADVPRIQAIYNHYITTSTATFEEHELDLPQVRARIDKVRSTGFPWTVVGGETIEGYAYARPWHERAAYRYSAEVSLYVAPGCLQRGVGTALYRDLLTRLSTAGMRTAIGGVALPNPASVALHEKFGFEKVAHYKAVGFKFDRWIDVAYYQYLLRQE